MSRSSTTLITTYCVITKRIRRYVGTKIDVQSRFWGRIRNFESLLCGLHGDRVQEPSAAWSGCACCLGATLPSLVVLEKPSPSLPPALSIRSLPLAFPCALPLVLSLCLSPTMFAAAEPLPPNASSLLPTLSLLRSYGTRRRFPPFAPCHLSLCPAASTAMAAATGKAATTAAGTHGQEGCGLPLPGWSQA